MNLRDLDDLFEAKEPFVEKSAENRPTELDLLIQTINGCKLACDLARDLKAARRTIEKAPGKQEKYDQLLIECEGLEKRVVLSSSYLNVEKVLAGQATESDYALGAKLQKDFEILQKEIIAFLESLRNFQK